MPHPSGPEHGLPPGSSVPQRTQGATRIDFTVFTRAQCDLVWRLFSDWEQWPRFSDCCSPNIQWQGPPWACGSRLITEIIKPARIKVDRVITMCTPPHCVAWISYLCGFTMEQYILFEPYLGGGSRISTWVEFTGAESSADAQQVRLLLEYLLQDWLTGFGRECDRVAESY